MAYILLSNNIATGYNSSNYIHLYIVQVHTSLKVIGKGQSSYTCASLGLTNKLFAESLLVRHGGSVGTRLDSVAVYSISVTPSNSRFTIIVGTGRGCR